MTRPDPAKIADPVTRDPETRFHLCLEPFYVDDDDDGDGGGGGGGDSDGKAKPLLQSDVGIGSQLCPWSVKDD